MQPRLATVGLEWATFQVLRRTNASLSRKLKIDDKVSADQRGHGLGVSMEVYSRSDLEQIVPPKYSEPVRSKATASWWPLA
jgi:hypothetical protein